MLPTDTKSLIERIAPVLAQRGDVELALLFGSYARGHATKTSDVDIAIIAPRDALLEIGADVSAAVGMEVDVIELEDANIPMQEALVRESVLIYERRRGAAAAWRTRTMLDLAIDLPWYRRMRDAWLKRVAERGLLHG